MKKITAYLIYRASDATLRVNMRRPTLRWDEVAWTVKLSVPEPWGALAGNIEIHMPEAPPTEITVTEVAHA